LKVDAEGRLRAVSGCNRLPDSTSVHLSEAAGPPLVAVLDDLGIGIQARLGSVTDDERFLGLWRA